MCGTRRVSVRDVYIQANYHDMAANNTKTDKKYPTHHNPIFLNEVEESRLSFKVEKTKDAYMTKDENGNPKRIEDKYELVAYYKYSDGKVEPLHITYDSLPCFITTQVHEQYGKFRKIYAKVSREREIFTQIRRVEAILQRRACEAMLTQDCTQVFSGWQVHVVKGSATVPVRYPDYITSKLQGNSVPVGKGTMPLDTIEAAFRTALEGTEDSPSIMRFQLVVLPAEGVTDKSPTKFMEVTKYPSKAKSDSDEDRANYERMSKEGMQKVFVWCDPNLRARFLLEGLLPEPAWTESKSGKTHYTTDYHLMQYVKKGYIPMISLSATFTCRSSVNTTTGVYSIKLEEKLTSGTLNDIRESEIAPRTDPTQSRYEQEFARPGIHVDSSTLARIAAEGGAEHDAEVDPDVYGEEVDT